MPTMLFTITLHVVSLTVVSAVLFSAYDGPPILITTWPYEDAVNAGWSTLVSSGGAAVDAVEVTGHTCEMLQCRHGVGFGGKPDENGETTLDAMIMDGTSHNVGAVGGLRRIKQAISVARKVLDNTHHTLLVGDQATEFAVAMGFKEEDLQTNYSRQLWQTWQQNNCQPNFRQNVVPDPSKSCGPYQPINGDVTNDMFDTKSHTIGEDNHDTIGIIAIDQSGNVASGASTNGLSYKVPGRVGDTPVAGAGSYADSEIGAATCTGNGDIMMRFLPSYQAVSLMGSGMTPQQAASTAVNDIRKKYPDFRGAVVAANAQGEYGAACHTLTNFAITVRTLAMPNATVYDVLCSTV